MRCAGWGDIKKRRPDPSTKKVGPDDTQEGARNTVTVIIIQTSDVVPVGVAYGFIGLGLPENEFRTLPNAGLFHTVYDLSLGPPCLR